jgi:hypothetical protein
VQVQLGSVDFGPVSGSGPQVSSTNVTFGSPVSQATAILTGFLVEFCGGNQRCHSDDSGHIRSAGLVRQLGRSVRRNHQLRSHR